MTDHKVIIFPGITKLDMPPGRVLDHVPDDLDGVVVMGWKKDGDTYFASSIADGGEVLWLMAKLKKALLEMEA